MTVNARIKPVERATGIEWAEWLSFMESIDAPKLTHHEIALQVYEKLDGSIDKLGWWTQAITVAYEQDIGRRIPGQRPDGTFQMSVSRSTRLAMSDLMDRWTAYAVATAAVTDRIAGDVKISGTDRRITWRTKATDGSSMIVTSEPKRNRTATIVAAQIGLVTAELNEQAKSDWTKIIHAFVETEN